MTDKDLSDLVGRIAEGIANDASWPLDGKVRRDAADALDALVAEVERLRAAAQDEREKAVAYLRADDREPVEDDSIERGEHTEEAGP